MHNIVGIDEKARGSDKKGTGGAGCYIDSSKIEKGHNSSNSTGGSREGARGPKVSFAWVGSIGRGGWHRPTNHVNTTKAPVPN